MLTIQLNKNDYSINLLMLIDREFDDYALRARQSEMKSLPRGIILFAFSSI